MELGLFDKGPAGTFNAKRASFADRLWSVIETSLGMKTMSYPVDAKIKQICMVTLRILSHLHKMWNRYPTGYSHHLDVSAVCVAHQFDVV